MTSTDVTAKRIHRPARPQSKMLTAEQVVRFAQEKHARILGGLAE